MNPCKAKLPDGNPCPNQADEGQKYCPFHLANPIKVPNKFLSIAGGVLGTAIAGLVFVAKFIASKKL